MLTSCLLANTDSVLDHVFRLRYACYQRSGAIAPSADERFRDRYDDLPNHFSFLLRNDTEDQAATVRISVVRPDLAWNDCPSRTVFGDHPAFAAIARSSFVEASRLCFGQRATRDCFHRLVAHLAAMADFHGTPWVVACPREEHTGIYRRMFGFAELAEPRPYYGVNFKTGLLAISLDELRERAGHFKSMRDSWQEALAYVSTMPIVR
jgi:hypothetical protein